jgi:hypothetical protein
LTVGVGFSLSKTLRERVAAPNLRTIFNLQITA